MYPTGIDHEAALAIRLAEMDRRISLTNEQDYAVSAVALAYVLDTHVRAKTYQTFRAIPHVSPK